MRTSRGIWSRVLVVLIGAFCASTLFASATNPIFVTVPVLPGPTTGSATINGAQGGRLSVGRYAVSVPPGAYVGSATITIYVPDPARMRCELSISPATGKFLVPVTLEANCTGANTPILSVQTVTLNPSTGIWSLVPNVSVNLLNGTVYTPLWHFSSWGQVGGKAGW